MPDLYVVNGGISETVFLVLVVIAVTWGLVTFARSKHGGWDD